jgi:hypothetical protein
MVRSGGNGKGAMDKADAGAPGPGGALPCYGGSAATETSIGRARRATFGVAFLLPVQ